MTAFKRLGLAIAFSPRLEALLFEAARLKSLLNASLVLVHVGDEPEAMRDTLGRYMTNAGLDKMDVTLRWERGDPGSQILSVCREEGVDLLIAGALKKEKLVKYYLGSIARKILRKADCSVLTLLNPSTAPEPFRNIVVNAEDSPFVHQALQVACELGSADNARWIHAVREIKLYGLTMTTARQSTEEEYEDLRASLVRDEIENVRKKLEDIPHEGLRLNFKILSGKSGFELSRFAALKKADLLVVGAPSRKFSLFDRFFTHDLEYVFADLPCNLLVVHPGKE